MCRWEALRPYKWRLGLFFGCLPLIFSTACFLHPASGTETSRELFGLEESDQDDTPLLAALLAPGTGPVGPASITLYDAGTMDGGMGGIQNADALCQGALNPSKGSNAIAFLSTSDQDLIHRPEVPETLPVLGPNGLLIANNWADLFGSGESIETSMYDAGVLPFPSSEFYSGTNVSGQYSSLNACYDWNSPSLQDTGVVGIADLTTENWINHALPVECAYAYHLLCAAW